MAQKRGEAAMGGKKHKSSKSGASSRKPHKMHIRHAANGGYIVEHHHKPAAADAGMPDMEEHAVPDIGALQQHVGDHMAPEEGAAGGGAPAPQMPGM